MEMGYLKKFCLALKLPHGLARGALIFTAALLVIFISSKPQATAETGSAEGISEAQILQFELSGFGDKGGKEWDVKGESADIFTDTVRLNDIEARLYGDKDNVKLTADSGTYDKNNAKVHLEKNVIVTTDSGAKLITDTLDWQQQNQKVSSSDSVDITKENMKVTGMGMEAEPNLDKVKLSEDVRVDIEDTDFSFSGKDNEQKKEKDTDDKEPITITCRGPLNVDYAEQIATFHKDVKVTHSEGEMYADKMVVFFDSETNKIKKVQCHGNVKIVNGKNITYSQKAVYTAENKKITLTGRPRLIIYSDSSMSFAE